MPPGSVPDRLPTRQDLDLGRPLEPLDYPGPGHDEPALLDGPALHPLDVHAAARALGTRGATPLAARRVVLAVGANASPAVLARKLHLGGVSGVLPIAPCVTRGIGVGHSAHVSLRGYVAAAPYALAGAVTRLQVSWLDAEQLAVLDRTEPNYARRRLDPTAHPVMIEGTGDDRPAVELYVSRHGVLGEDGAAVGLRAQPALFAILARWEGDTRIVDPARPEATVARLAHPDVQEDLRTRWIRQGHALHDGLRLQ